MARQVPLHLLPLFAAADSETALRGAFLLTPTDLRAAQALTLAGVRAVASREEVVGSSGVGAAAAARDYSDSAETADGGVPLEAVEHISELGVEQLPATTRRELSRLGFEVAGALAQVCTVATLLCDDPLLMGA